MTSLSAFRNRIGSKVRTSEHSVRKHNTLVRIARNDDDWFDDEGPALRPAISSATIGDLIDGLDTSDDRYAYDADGLYAFESDEADRSVVSNYDGPDCDDDDLH